MLLDAALLRKEKEGKTREGEQCGLYEYVASLLTFGPSLMLQCNPPLGQRVLDLKVEKRDGATAAKYSVATAFRASMC